MEIPLLLSMLCRRGLQRGGCQANSWNSEDRLGPSSPRKPVEVPDVMTRAGKRRLDEWIVAGLPGQKIDGAWYFDEAEVDAWRAERGDGKPPRGTISLTEARRRKIIADTALARHELRKRWREYMPRAEVEEVWCRLVGNFRARLLMLPSKLAVRVASFNEPNMVRAMLTDAV